MNAYFYNFIIKIILQSNIDFGVLLLTFSECIFGKIQFILDHVTKKSCKLHRRKCRVLYKKR